MVALRKSRGRSASSFSRAPAIGETNVLGPNLSIAKDIKTQEDMRHVNYKDRFDATILKKQHAIPTYDLCHPPPAYLSSRPVVVGC